MIIEFPLSDFCIINLSSFDSGFNKENSPFVEFKDALILLYKINNESALSLILAFKSCFS